MNIKQRTFVIHHQVWLVMMSLEEPEVVTRRKTLAASPSAGSIDGRYTEKAPPGTLPAN